MGRLRFSAWLVLGLWALGVASTASAQSQWTAVFFVEGRGARQGQANVERVARSHLMVVPASEVREATRRLEADVETPEGRTAVARDRNASLVVVGTMSGRNRNTRIAIEIQDAEGQRLADAASRLPRTGPERERFANVVGAAFQQANEELDRRARAAREEELAADTREVVAVDDEIPGADDDDDDDGPAAERTKPWIVGLVGIGGRGRNAHVDLTSGRTRNYGYPMYPELTLYFEGRPLASLGAPLHGIYAVAQFGVALSLNTRDGMTGIEYGSSAWRLDVLAGYLHELGPIELGANIGFAYDTFQIDTNPVFPAVEYPSIRIGLAGRIPIFEMLELGPDLEKLLRIDIDAGIRIVMGTGSLAPFFAESASAFGFDVIASLTGMLDFGLSYAVRFGYIGYALSMGAPLPAPADSGTGGLDGGIVLTIGLGWQI